MTTKNTGRNQALAAALTLLGASLGVTAPASAASDTTGIWVKDQATSKQNKGETKSNQHKFWNPSATQIKGETRSNQYKEHAPSAMFLKHNVAGSTQIKGEAPSAKFLKLDATKSNQIKGETHSNQIKLDTPNESH